MKKISLNLDDLQVDTFTTSGVEGRTGTVQGHGWVSDTTCEPSDLGGCDSYWCGSDENPNSGAPSCGVTCDITGIVYKCNDAGTCYAEW